MRRAPATWTALPPGERRAVLRAVRFGSAPLSSEAAPGARDWARWVLARSRRYWLVLAAYVVVVGLVALVTPRALVALSAVPVFLLAAWVERRDARRILDRTG